MSKAALKPPPAADLYDRDFYLWTQTQAALLRSGRFDELDLENLMEEVRSVGLSEKREIKSRLTILLGHLLKWKYQPGCRTSGWRGTIEEQRRQLHDVLEASPSLRNHPTQIFSLCYLSARLLAARDTGIDFTLFPAEPPFTAQQALTDDFYPKEPDLIDQS